MKFYSRSNCYKGSNVVFNVTSREAVSYNWWTFVKVIEGDVVFNDYRYSPTTAKHQSKVRRLMQKLGIGIDLVVQVPSGLQSFGNLEVVRLAHAAEMVRQSALAETKRQERNEKARERRARKKSDEYALAQNAKRVLRLVCL